MGEGQVWEAPKVSKVSWISTVGSCVSLVVWLKGEESGQVRGWQIGKYQSTKPMASGMLDLGLTPLDPDLAKRQYSWVWVLSTVPLQFYCVRIIGEHLWGSWVLCFWKAPYMILMQPSFGNHSSLPSDMQSSQEASRPAKLMKGQQSCNSLCLSCLWTGPLDMVLWEA